jgi:hypothetical protein
MRPSAIPNNPAPALLLALPPAVAVDQLPGAAIGRWALPRGHKQGDDSPDRSLRHRGSGAAAAEYHQHYGVCCDLVASAF